MSHMPSACCHRVREISYLERVDLFEVLGVQLL